MPQSGRACPLARGASMARGVTYAATDFGMTPRETIAKGFDKMLGRL
jgi:hypothetical protein